MPERRDSYSEGLWVMLPMSGAEGITQFPPLDQMNKEEAARGQSNSTAAESLPFMLPTQDGSGWIPAFHMVHSAYQE